MIGTKLGSYEITAQIGEGGMGRVYKAKDSRLGREVALKVLPEGLTQDAERLARFEREAKLLASLNHPNIAQIYGLETSGGSPALVMELVEGPTLADRLAQGSLSIDESLSVARQVAEALEEAHEKGIIHRDLKPQNVKASPEGKVKVLDFGLAKAMEPAGAAGGGAVNLTHSPTLTSPALGTVQGVIVGTAAYMSPEQARGRAVDKRADLWAFGVVLWEMLNGRRLFEGETVSDTLAAVLRADVDFDALPAATPPALRRLLRRLLERNPKNRLHDIADARILLQEVEAGAGPEEADGVASGWRRARLAGALLVVAMATAAATWWLAARRPAPAPAGHDPVLRLELPLPSRYPIDFIGGQPLGLEQTALDVSQDGSRLVYVTKSTGFSGIVALDLDSGDHRPLAGTAGAYRPVLSPDGQWVAFLADGRLKRIPYAGGGVDDLAAAPVASDLSWGRDGKLYWLGQEGDVAWRMAPALGSPVETLMTSCGCAIVRQGPEPGELILVRKRGGVVRVDRDGHETPLGIEGGDVRALRDGILLFTGFGRLMAARSAGGGDVGRPQAVLDGLRTSTLGTGQFAVSGNGTLVYAGGGDVRRAHLVIRDRSGSERTLPFEAFTYGALDSSPDGSRIVVGSSDASPRLRVLDVTSGTTQFIEAAGSPVGPTFSPDGAHVDAGVRVGDGWQLVEYAIASAAPPKILASSPHRLYPGGWSQDGRYLALGESGDGQSWISIWDRQGGELRRLISATDALLWAPVFSPDDRYIAYTAVGATGSEVYVMPFPGGDRRWLVSAGTGEEPQWRRDASRLVFRRGRSWYGVSYEDRDTFTFGAPQLLFEGPYLNIGGMEYRILADGSALLLRSESGEESVDRLNVVVNWLDEVRRKLVQGSAR